MKLMFGHFVAAKGQVVGLTLRDAFGLWMMLDFREVLTSIVSYIVWRKHPMLLHAIKR